MVSILLVLKMQLVLPLESLVENLEASQMLELMQRQSILKLRGSQHMKGLEVTVFKKKGFLSENLI
jgi:hypothetical protein